MPKLDIRVPHTSDRSARPPVERLTITKPCPRCREPLEQERSYQARGLTGTATTEYRFKCPACDARYHYSRRTERWREITED